MKNSAGLTVSSSEVISFLTGWIPYLNTGIIVLVMGLLFERLGFKITRKEFKRKPWQSLFWGLALVSLSGFFSIIMQTQMSGFQPFLAFIVLIFVYFVLTQT